ncbi:cation:proton antiporter [bacterium]|nr:cation:proton antiporter [bacterium]
MSAIILSVGVIIFLAHFFTSVFEKTRIPDVLLLMLLGILLGPILHIVCPEDFGKFGNVATTIALIVILFEGGINLNIRQIKDSLDETAVVSLASFLATMVIVAVAAWGFFKLEPIVSVMLGAMLGGTSSAVVIPIIKKLKLKRMTYMVLFLESALTDVICIVVAMSLMQAYFSGSVDTGRIFGSIISSLLLAAVIGTAGAFVWVILLKRVKNFPNTAMTTLAYIFVIFGLSEFLGYSGAIASLAFGITLANLKDFPVEQIQKYTRFSMDRTQQISKYERSFFEEVVFLLKIFFFIYLGLSIKFSNVEVILVGFAISLILFLARGVVVGVAMPKKIPRADAEVMAALIPKGLAAAVLASIPLQMGIEGGEIVQGIAYTIVFFSIAFAAFLVMLMERRQKFVMKIYDKLLTAFPENNGNIDKSE